MLKIKIIVIASTLLLAGCATYDKVMSPVDGAVNSTKSTYQSVSHSVSETMDGLGDSATRAKSSFFESSLIKVFVSDKTITENREKNYVVWNSASKYNVNSILQNSLANTEIKNPNALNTSQQMQILKDYFFTVLKQEHAEAFSAKYKRPDFNEFLTDRQNIEEIHQYKTALLESEHQWREDLDNIQKKVAQLMLSTLYSAPLLNYVSYDPYKKDIYFSVESSKPGFKEKIKVSAEKDFGLQLKDNISRIQPSVYFEFSDDVLELVGINIKYDNKSYVSKVVDSAYVRQTDVVFTSEDISLKTLDVQYYDIVKNVKPPEWYNNLNMDESFIIGYGEGISKDDAKEEAYKEIAMSIQTIVSSKTESENVVEGSNYASSFKSSSQQKVEEVSITGSKVLKVEKKDGLWFVAISHENKIPR